MLNDITRREFKDVSRGKDTVQRAHCTMVQSAKQCERGYFFLFLFSFSLLSFLALVKYQRNSVRTADFYFLSFFL